MKLEFLGFPNCPNAKKLRINLRAVLRRIQGNIEFEDINQAKLKFDDVRRGYPSPTILADGRDLFGWPAPHGPALQCRLYDGGIPSKDYLEKCIRRIRLTRNESPSEPRASVDAGPKKSFWR